MPHTTRRQLLWPMRRCGVSGVRNKIPTYVAAPGEDSETTSSRLDSVASSRKRLANMAAEGDRHFQGWMHDAHRLPCARGTDSSSFSHLITRYLLAIDL